MDAIKHLFQLAPLLALFITIALGYLLGKFRIKHFVLGGIAGSLLVGVLIGQFGITLPNGIGSIFFALFIYAVGYQGGPQFFRSLNRQTMVQLFSAMITCLLGLLCVLGFAYGFHLDAGTAAGLAAGGLTQSAMIGTAGDAIAKLGLSTSAAHAMQSQVAVGYAVCYLFGSFGPILLLASVFPSIMKWDLRKEAINLATKLTNTNNHRASAKCDFPGDKNSQQHNIILTNKKFHLSSVESLSDYLQTKNIIITAVHHLGEKVPATPELILHRGFELTLYGPKENLELMANELGKTVCNCNITDYLFFGLGMALGTVLGLISFKLFGISINLGAGVGCLFSGLIMGWLRSRHPLYGNLPTGASNFLRDFGLTVFVAAVGITAGPQAIATIKQYGMELFLLGIGVTLIPQVISFYFSYYILKIKNPIILLSTIAGGRSANPGFAALLDKAGNATPVVPFTATYAIANILLTLWGPIIIALVTKYHL